MKKTITMPRFKKLSTFSLLLFLLCSMYCVQSQSLTQKNWYFGNGTQGIQFGRPDFEPSLINKPALGTGGSAIATDANTGNLLFYTDGQEVYDVTNTPMPNSGLGGNTNTNQPALITPVPGAPNQYYIFTRTLGGAIEQAIVQTDAPGNETFPTPPLGNVISKNTSTGLTAQAEGMIIIPAPNGIDSWLITQTAGSDTYTVTAITAGGLTSTVVPALGLPLTAASFSFHKETGRLAVAPKNQNSNVVVLNFNTTNGSLTFDPVFNQFLLNTGAASTTAEAVYDTEWSKDGAYLYISRNGDASIPVAPDVLQVDLTTAGLPVSILPAGLDIVRSYGLQMGPDSTIYHLYENSLGQFVMGQITDTDSVATLVGYTPEVFPGTNFQGRQFSMVSPPAQTTHSITFTTLGSCTNSPITFFPTVVPAADSVVWDFADGTPTLNSWSPVHTFQDAPTGDVTATAFSNGVAVATATQTLSLTEFDLQLSVQSDTTACSCELKFPKIPTPPCTAFTIAPQSQGGASPTYQWYGPSGLLAGKTSLTLDEVDSAGYYYVKATDGVCSVAAGQNVKEYHVEDQRSNIWHFGNAAGIDFNPMFNTPQEPIVSITSPVNAPEGVATISDRNGQVILSTDGYQVYDRDGNPLITGAPTPPVTPSSSQSSLIVPVPGDETLYYIVTTEPAESGTYRLSYMLFDLKLGTIGGIVDPDNNPATDPKTVLYVKSTERLTGNDTWIISHEYGNNSFRAYRVTATGLSTPTISDIGSDHALSSSQAAQGYMKLGAQNRLAVALSDGATNAIELFDFVDSTGAVTNYRRIDINEPGGQVYAVEFSQGGNKLYATVNVAGGSIIYEYAINPQGVVTFLQKTPVINEDLGAMATGPDGQTYIAVNGKNYLFQFTANEDILQPTTGFAPPLNFPLTTGTSTKGLPNFIQTLGEPAQSPGMSITGNCVNTPVDFAATPTDQYRDDYLWLVRDQSGATVTSSTEQNFQFTFTTPGTYQVTLNITSTCVNGQSVDPAFPQTQSLIINPEPGAAITTSDGTLVFCQVPSTKGLTAAATTGSNLSFAWTTGETVNPITVTGAGTYGVTITDNVTGCSSDATIALFNTAPIVDLGPDFAICSDETRTLNALNPAATGFNWQIDNGATAGTSQLFNVNTALTGTHEYKVTVTDGTCSASDAVLVTVNLIPTLGPPTLVEPTCGNNNGSVGINIISTGNFSVAFGAQPLRTNEVSPTTVTYNSLTAGTYPVTVTNELTGCDVQDAVGLSNSTFEITAPVVPATCGPVPVNITRTAGLLGTNPLSYIVTNTTTGALVPGTPVNGIVANPFPTIALNPGTYVIQATDGINCIATANISIPLGTQTQFVLDPSCGTIEATPTNFAGTGLYTWDPAASITSVTTTATSSIATISAAGTYNVTVTVDDSGPLCPSTQSISVTVENIPAAISSTTPCADEITLSASPVGPYTYTWTTPTTPRNGQQIILGPGNDGSYTVTVLSATSGCSATSAPSLITLLGNVSIDLTSTLACQGQEFTLTATATPQTASIAWTLNGVSLSGATNPLTATTGGRYKVDALVNGCPPVSDELNVVLLPITEGNLPSAAVICNDPANPFPNTRSETLDPGDKFSSYLWSTGEVTQTIVADQAGIYTVDLINLFGCPSTDQTEVTVECEPILNAPNAFKPSSTVQQNNYFSVYPIFVAEEGFQVFIFNRWGEMVYQSDDLNFEWNGNYNNTGLALPPGTYSWVAKYKSNFRPEEGFKQKHGGVVLMR